MSPALNQSMPPNETEIIAGFLNRRACFSRITQLAALASPEHPLSVIWVALDRFKKVNESFGHQGGDEFIAQIGRRLRSKTETDTGWFQMAGDEFVCLLPDCDYDHVQEITARLLREIETPLPMGDLTLHPSASLGIAILAMDENPFTCLERADQAMNTAKRAGGGRLVTSGSEPLPGRMGVHLARHELELESKLHQSLNQGGLSLHYQPCMNADGSILSFEALMRCADPQLTPSEFIPIAEKTGLIVRLGEWALLEGARFAQRLAASGRHIPVSINVSRAQLATTRFAQSLHAALLCANVDPALIELELTESLFMDHSRTVQNNLRAAHEAGVTFAIDDFGTGYSCLANLKDITASKVKLDREFVIALPYDPRAFSVVRAIAKLGDELGMLVVAEGVENKAQLDKLHDAGITITQGHFHARPMPEVELLAWLNKRDKPT